MNNFGFGLMRLPTTDPTNPASVDIEYLKKMVDKYIAEGGTYFDTAWMYNRFASEKASKVVLVDRYPRDSFTLATKLNAGFFNSLEDADEIFNKQLENTGAGYFDYYLLHGLDDEMYKKHESVGTFAWLLEKKAQGLVKHAGFSFHAGPELLDHILTLHPEMEFVQLQINYLDWENPGIAAKACYEVAVKHNKPIIVMEPVKGGTLANVPEVVENHLRACHPDWTPASWAMRFCLNLDKVVMTLSGMSNMEQMEDNIATVKSFEPLTEKELKVLEEAVELLKVPGTIPCTGCSYCTDGCPMNIAIPQYFSLYNVELLEYSGKGWHPQGTYYDNLAGKFGKASDCIACGQCESMCPQHLPIIENLKKVAENFEN